MGRFPAITTGLLLSLLVAIPGCLPSRIAIDLAPGDGRLDETEVMETPGPDHAAKIALVDVTGMISHLAAPGLVAGGHNPVDALAAALAKAESDPKVRAVILRINSPGGTVAATDTAYNEVRRFRERTSKPVIASEADVAASGGYYLALACDRIIAEPSTITGSIGVLMQTFNFSQGMAKLGIDGRAVISRPNKNLASPFEPAQPEHYAILQGLVDQMYAEFTNIVRERRPSINASDFDELTDGRVFTGRQALDVGLVDEIGGVHEAFAAAQRLASLHGARLVKYHAEGAPVRSAYASATLPSPQANPWPNPLGLALEQVTRGHPPVAYYLWSPGLN
ncbi:MAG: signal peptide peptidase SppA [Phycisphaerales bacterium]|nr:signal peptide peptidase SppA [Phycisphaerales bacterium]